MKKPFQELVDSINTPEAAISLLADFIYASQQVLERLHGFTKAKYSESEVPLQNALIQVAFSQLRQLTGHFRTIADIVFIEGPRILGSFAGVVPGVKIPPHDHSH